MGECRPEWEIYAELAEKPGLGNEFWDGDFEKCVDDLLEPAGITFADLKWHPEGIKYDLPERPPRLHEQFGFQTPSGKVEIASSMIGTWTQYQVLRRLNHNSARLPGIDITAFATVNETGKIKLAIHGGHDGVSWMSRLWPFSFLDEKETQ